MLHLACRLAEPARSITMDEIIANFWPKSDNPESRLVHLLWTMKSKLQMLRHLLVINSIFGSKKLVNIGVYLNNDYQEFTQTIARAKALERAGEWGFARKEYLRAFSLFRGEPFKKNFDN